MHRSSIIEEYSTSVARSKKKRGGGGIRRGITYYRKNVLFTDNRQEEDASEYRRCLLDNLAPVDTMRVSKGLTG